MLKYSLILVIPCYNEELRIDKGAYLNFLKGRDNHLLVFVNDGSTDNTETALQNLLSSHDNIVVIQNSKNIGKSETVRSGFMYALKSFECDYIGFIDADLSTPLEEIDTFSKILKSNDHINLVIGARVQMLGRSISRNLYRHWFSRIIATLICKILDEPIYDTQCGAKLFRKPYAEELFQKAFISKWLFDVEILARYKKKNKDFKNSIVEVPVSQWVEKDGSKLRYHYIFRIIFDLLRIKKHYFKN